MVFRGIRARGAVIALAIAGTWSAHACTYEKAHYVYSSNPSLSVSFTNIGKRENVLSTIALQLSDKQSGASFWFLFDAGSARYITMISTSDVRSPGWEPPTDGSPRLLCSMHFFAWSKRMVFDENLPMAGARAPDTIFLPDLSETLWYRAEPRIGIGHGVFTLKRCGR